jgi:ribosome maturation factor RimP
MRALSDIQPIVQQKLDAMGFELYDIKLHHAGKHSLLRLCVDSDAGVTIDDCERISRELSVVLDVEEFSNHPYSLEVSSPGIERPLVKERDFRRALGRSVTLRLKTPPGGAAALTGVVTGCENGVVALDTGEATQNVAVADILEGKMEIRFK